MAVANIEVIDPELVPEAEAKTIPADKLARTLPPGPLEESEVEGQYAYWKYYRCGCGSVFRVMLDTDHFKYFYCACGKFMYRA